MGICWAWERGGLVEARERQGAGEVGSLIAHREIPRALDCL